MPLGHGTIFFEFITNSHLYVDGELHLGSVDLGIRNLSGILNLSVKDDARSLMPHLQKKKKLNCKKEGTVFPEQNLGHSFGKMLRVSRRTIPGCVLDFPVLQQTVTMG